MAVKGERERRERQGQNVVWEIRGQEKEGEKKHKKGGRFGRFGIGEIKERKEKVKGSE